MTSFFYIPPRRFVLAVYGIMISWYNDILFSGGIMISFFYNIAPTWKRLVIVSSNGADYKAGAKFIEDYMATHKANNFSVRNHYDVKRKASQKDIDDIFNQIKLESRSKKNFAHITVKIVNFCLGFN